MRHSRWIKGSVAAIAMFALGVSVMLTPAEAKGKPPGAGAGRGRDTTAPTITCPSEITTDAAYSSGAYVTFAVSATDDKDPSPALVVSPGPGWFPVGTTTVTATATDWKGNTATATFDVTVLPFTQTVLPPSGVRTYKAYWTDTDGYPYFEWDVTVAADGSVSGTGVQTNLLLVYDEFNHYAGGPPAGLPGTGIVSGTIASDGTCQLESSSTFLYWNYGDYDADGNLVETEGTTSFSGPVTAVVDSYGNLYFDASPLASPTYYWDYPVWYVQ